MHLRFEVENLVSAALLMAGLLLSANAQSDLAHAGLRPVHWSAASSAPPLVRKAEQFQVQLRAGIDPGWHLYALPERDVFPLATEIARQQGDPVELLRVEQSRPVHALDPESHIRTAYFSHAAVFPLKLQAAPALQSGPHEVHALVRYQACNDRLCLPPRSEVVSVPFTAVP